MRLTVMLRFGGNIGYSVRPSEWQKGYASQMIGLLLPICRQFEEKRVLVICGQENEPSCRTILKNKGVLENEVTDTSDLSKYGVIQRSGTGSHYNVRKTCGIVKYGWWIFCPFAGILVQSKQVR